MKHSGFTLIELLIAMAITALTIGFVSYFTIDVSSSSTSINIRLETQRELEMTLRTMLSEIRSMGPSANGSYDIALADATNFEFYSDIDGDGQFEQIRYFLNGTTLEKGVTKPVAGTPPTYPVANEVISDVVHYVVPGAIFAYYAEGLPSEIGALPSPVDVSKIRMVSVSGTVDEDTAHPPGPVTISINATIRNLRGEI